MKKKICIILIVVFVALFSTSAYFIFDHYRQEAQQAELYDSLADMVDCAADTEEEPAEPVLYTEEKTVLPELAELYQQNSDLAGWIRIEDTNINYPVMHTPDNPDFYLKHGFDKEYSDYGCPYVQENCDVQLPSDNVILYGHHMKNGSMFSGLTEYKKQEFYDSHSVALLLTPDKNYEIEFFAGYVASVQDKAWELDFPSDPDFTEWLDKTKERSCFTSGITPAVTDRILTLSTCSYEFNNARFVLLGVLKPEE